MTCIFIIYSVPFPQILSAYVTWSSYSAWICRRIIFKRVNIPHNCSFAMTNIKDSDLFLQDESHIWMHLKFQRILVQSISSVPLGKNKLKCLGTNFAFRSSRKITMVWGYAGNGGSSKVSWIWKLECKREFRVKRYFFGLADQSIFGIHDF